MKENQPWKFQICPTRSPHFVGMSLKLALSPANLCRRYGTFSSHNMPNACNMRICIRFSNFLDSQILQHRSGHRRSSNREDFYHDYCHQPERWVGRYSYYFTYISLITSRENYALYHNSPLVIFLLYDIYLLQIL